MTYLLLAAAAAVFLLWPAKSKDHQLVTPSPFAGTSRPQSHPTYQSSMLALTSVRQRLLQTEHLGEQEKAAIDRITLSLVAGSDKD